MSRALLCGSGRSLVYRGGISLSRCISTKSGTGGRERREQETVLCRAAFVPRAQLLFFLSRCISPRADPEDGTSRASILLWRTETNSVGSPVSLSGSWYE